MAQEHFDRLTAIDASFLHQEGPTSHMHVGAIVALRGPAAALRRVPRRTPRAPAPRAALPPEARRPAARDRPPAVGRRPDLQPRVPRPPDRAARPGSEEQLLRLAARIFSQQLDRSKPLWEMWLVEGLEDGRFALISKTHHALIDGVSRRRPRHGASSTSTPVPTEIEHPDEAVAARRPSRRPPRCSPPAALGAVPRPALDAGRGRALGALCARRARWREAREAAEGLGEIVWAGLNPAPETPLNVEIGPHRRFVGVRSELRRLQARQERLRRHGQRRRAHRRQRLAARMAALARRAHRGPGAARAGARSRSAASTSTARWATASRRCAARCRSTSRTRSRACAPSSEAMDGLKESKQAVGAEVLASVQNFAPPTILAQASRLNFSTRLFNLIVTNVPGPQFPLYVRGPRAARRLPGRVPAQGPRAGDRDHVLQRAD